MTPAGLADHLLGALEGPAWHGYPLEELLEGVDAAEAAARPIANGHSIWEIVLHVAAWARIAAARLAGDTGTPSERDDWPPASEPTAEAWLAAREALRESHRDLAGAVREMDPAPLDATVPGCDYTARTMLHGVAEHAAYHGGQIVLLLKLVRASARRD